MSFLRKEKSHLSAALDVGSRTIKGLVFEVSDTGLIIKAHKRIVIQMPAAYRAPRIVGELHTTLADIIKEFGRIPGKVIAGFGTSLAEYRVEQWDVEPREKMRLDRKYLAGYFNGLFGQHEEKDRATMATPVSIEINGYPVRPEVLDGDARHSLFMLGGACRDIRFRTVVSYFPSEIRTLLAEMKQMLGGVPIEFIPLASVYQEALAYRLNVRDALLIDIGGTSTMLVLLKDGMLVQTVAFPFGVFSIGKKVAKETSVWSQCLRNAADSLYSFGPLTGETYLVGGGARIPELRSYVEQGEWLKSISYAATPHVIVLEGKSLLARDALAGFLQGPEDAGLASVVEYSMHHEVII
ncbi:MAG: hypothetical protein HY007_00185 [Candidatus Sungbacteria bacterium]|nr:hypothetical protein [Candidatus Sungbacteria bacterium]